MNIMKNKKTYSGQALAIIMVVIVVCSIIGFSMFSRSLRDKRSTVQERYSAEALEVNDNILDSFLQIADDQDLKDILDIDKEYSNYDIDYFLNGFNDTLNTCKVEPSNNNKYTMKLFYGESDTIYQVEPGQAFSFVVPEGETIPNECLINVKFQSEDIPANTGFMKNMIFRTVPTETTIKTYDYPDAETYCLSTYCPNYQRFPSYSTWNPNTTFQIGAGGVNLDRAQIIAINNRIRLSYEPVGCGDYFKTLILRASATCNGVFRSKEAVIPVHKAHFSIFNYVLFNGNGEMNSYQ